jgi:flagellin-like protein
MRKLLKSKKALSPVVAAIILIAVTVAVSIAVAAWMGSLTIGFMDTKELTVTELTFNDGGTVENITATVTNSGTSDLTVAQIKVNGVTKSFDGSPVTLTAGASDVDIVIVCDWTDGSKYSVSMFATDGTLVGSYTGTA